MLSKVQILNKHTHAQTKIKDSSNYKHIEDQQIIPVTFHEVIELASEYPIVFVKHAETGQFQLVALLGLTQGENLYFHESGWRSHCIPSILKNYPFALMPDPHNPEHMLVGMHKSDELLSSSGHLLFDDQGNETEYLKKRKGQLIDYYERDQVSKSIVNLLADNNLFKQQVVSINLNGQQYEINGIYVIDEINLNNMSDGLFLDFRKRAILPSIYAHLASLHQLKKLIAIKANVLSRG